MHQCSPKSIRGLIVGLYQLASQYFSALSPLGLCPISVRSLRLRSFSHYRSTPRRYRAEFYQEPSKSFCMESECLTIISPVS